MLASCPPARDAFPKTNVQVVLGHVPGVTSPSSKKQHVLGAHTAVHGARRFFFDQRTSDALKWSATPVRVDAMQPPTLSQSQLGSSASPSSTPSPQAAEYSGGGTRMKLNLAALSNGGVTAGTGGVVAPVPVHAAASATAASGGGGGTGAGVHSQASSAVSRSTGTAVNVVAPMLSVAPEARSRVSALSHAQPHPAVTTSSSSSSSGHHPDSRRVGCMLLSQSSLESLEEKIHRASHRGGDGVGTALNSSLGADTQSPSLWGVPYPDVSIGQLSPSHPLSRMSSFAQLSKGSSVPTDLGAWLTSGATSTHSSMATAGAGVVAGARGLHTASQSSLSLSSLASSVATSPVIVDLHRRVPVFTEGGDRALASSHGGRLRSAGGSSAQRRPTPQSHGGTGGGGGFSGVNDHGSSTSSSDGIMMDGHAAALRRRGKLRR
jgi:hypothetical protein